MSRPLPRNSRRAAEWAIVVGALNAIGCGGRHEVGTRADAPVAMHSDDGGLAPHVTHGESSQRTLDLLPVFSQGAIDAAGPIVDLGEPQAQPFLLPPLPIATESLNGNSWVTVGPRLRVRVPVDVSAAPTALRVRIRHAHARAVLAIIDGIPTRQVALPVSNTPSVVTIPLLADRFRRAIADVELRFIGVARPAMTTSSRDARRANLVTETRRVVVRIHGRRRVVTRTITRPAGQQNPAAAAAVDIDWLHLVHGDDVASVRTADLVSDVRSEGAPRRALTLYAPTSLSAVTVIPPAAELRAAFSAEGIRGRSRAQTVAARVRIEADGIEPIEREISVTAGSPWQELRLDLSAVGGRATRLSVSAREGGDTRLAIAEPRLIARTDVPPTPPPPVRHVVLLVVRGARYDRFAPTVSPRFTAGGFARLAREGLVARAIAPSPHELAAFASAVTGLPADVHGLFEDTDTIDEAAPTVAARLRDAGVATAAFSDDAWFIGSGIDRGFTERESCPNDAATCHAEVVIGRAADWLVTQGERRSFVLIATRAGLPPLDGPADLLTAIDPSTEDGIITPEQSALFAQRSRRGALNLESTAVHRLDALYDAALAGVDRGVAHLLDRLREANELNSTAIIVVGDRGTMLGESGLVGDGPMNIAALSETVLLVRTPGVAPQQLEGTVSVLDGIATAAARIETVRHEDDPATDGPRSVFSPEAGGLHPRGVVFVASLRGEVGLAFGSLVGIPRPSGQLALYHFDGDPLGQVDVAADHPIAEAFAERVLAGHRAALESGDEARANAEGERTTTSTSAPPLHRYAPSTRALPPNVAQHLHAPRH